MSSSSGGPRRGGGGGGGGGRGGNNRGGGSGSGSSSRRSGGSNSGSNANNNNSNRSRNTRRGPGRQKSQEGGKGGSLTDEDVLIAFMPFLKGNHHEATRIHEEYQSGNDQRAFLKAARSFLQREQQQQQQTTTAESTTTTNGSTNNTESSSPALSTESPVAAAAGAAAAPALSEDDTPRPDPPGSMQEHQVLGTPQRPAKSDQDTTPSVPAATEQPQQQQQQDSAIANNSNGTTSSVEHGIGALRLTMNDNTDDPIVPLSFPGTSASSIWGASAIPPTNSTIPSPITPPRPAPPAGQTNHQTPTSPWDTSTAPPQNIQQDRQLSPLHHPETEVSPPPPPPAAEKPPAASSKKEAYHPKRLWTHFEEQPGIIRVNGVSGEDLSFCLSLGPREELTAHWALPVDYLLKRQPDIIPVNRSIEGLTVGLFRRGCTENGGQASIISKDAGSYAYWHEPAANRMRGKVPFYSPRTPGNVLFRMYWEKDPLHTLAIGPTLHVRVAERDFDGSTRFILSNFKGRKSNPTSLSSLHSLAVVLETPLSRRNEGTGRAVWGCIQEARKVIDACHQEYIKTSNKMLQLEERVEELKKQVEEEKSHESSSPNSSESSAESPGDIERSTAGSAAVFELHEKTRMLMSGRASCERKWRDSQLAFACILKAALMNRTMPFLLRHEWMSKMRVEYELWCPLSEEFACPDENVDAWFECINELPSSIMGGHFRLYQQARVKMQMRTMGFDVNSMSLEDALFPQNRGSPNQRTMDPGAVAVFNNISAAMGQYYQDLFIDEELVVRKRELIRQRTEQHVRECGAFPPGTEVVIFGSSANGFGSPKSDIDMCLHLPPGAKLHEEDGTGSEAMAKLAEYFEASGMMKKVDTARLGARIPIIMYNCPDPLSEDSAEDKFIECDLSMHNPLAVLNTSLLRSYAEITPVTRVLASIIKRWAKARDINSPARHTLSSYGYIIMLLHFMTYRKRTGNGLVSPVAPPEGLPRGSNEHQVVPLLPNLQWMDPIWANMPKGTPYREIATLPKNMMKHPMKENSSVNTYFCKPKTPNEKAVLQMLFPGQDLSLAILLASFFRYYAYEFDYKRHVVSLHSTANRGIVEREVKAELDGWRNYSAALAIEDPFELDYDVAHVLRGGYYHRIRREFALAYTKIADAASGRPNSWNKGDLRAMTGKDLIDWICEPVSTEREQQQPPPTTTPQPTA